VYFHPRCLRSNYEVSAALVAGRGNITLAQIGTELIRMGHPPPRGGNRRAPSSVKALLDQARMAGLLVAA
jgi:hypothetical protein